MRRIKPFNAVDQLFICCWIAIHRQLIKIQDLKLMPYRKKITQFYTNKFQWRIFLINKLLERNHDTLLNYHWDPIILQI